MKSKINENEHCKIIEMYKSGMSLQKIANIYTVSSVAIKHILSRNNVEIRDNSHKGRIYTLNENYFDIIDSCNKAYILGLLYSDGCNYTKLNHIKLELQEKDKSILDAINAELESNRPLKHIDLHSKNENWQNTYRLSIVNKHMSEKLNDLGMVSNKSLILEFPYFLDTCLLSSFIRGYMDGDGHIHIFGGSKFVTLVGTEMFCNSVKDICKKELNIDINVHNLSKQADSITKIIQICGKQKIKTFLDYLYKDADLYIERKYESYKLFCEYYNKTMPLSN